MRSEIRIDVLRRRPNSFQEAVQYAAYVEQLSTCFTQTGPIITQTPNNYDYNRNSHSYYQPHNNGYPYAHQAYQQPSQAYQPRQTYQTYVAPSHNTHYQTLTNRSRPFDSRLPHAQPKHNSTDFSTVNQVETLECNEIPLSNQPCVTKSAAQRVTETAPMADKPIKLIERNVTSELNKIELTPIAVQPIEMPSLSNSELDETKPVSTIQGTSNLNSVEHNLNLDASVSSLISEVQTSLNSTHSQENSAIIQNVPSSEMPYSSTERSHVDLNVQTVRPPSESSRSPERKCPSIIKYHLPKSKTFFTIKKHERPNAPTR